MDPPADPGREPMPDDIRPMLATLSRLPRDERNWAYEIKWDGVRAIGYCEGGRIRLESRNLRDITSQYPEIRKLGEELGSREAVLDGEVVAFDEDGRPDFQRLQGRMHVGSDAAVRRRMADTPVVYVIFDLLYLEGRSLMDLPYEERRARLEGLGFEGPSWQIPRKHLGDGKGLLELTSQRGLEGVVAKRLDSAYVPGRRSSAWLKVKNVLSQELVIGGWLPGQGRREGLIGALLVGYRTEDGELRYAGRVGTGYTEETLRMLQERLEPLRRKTSPFDGRQPPKESIFVEPRLVAEIEFREWTQTRTLRAPAFKGLRDDKDPHDVVIETPKPPPKPSQAPDAASRGKRSAKKGNGATELGFELRNGVVEIEGREVKLSNLDKVLYPKARFKKGDVIAYYAAVAPFLLPHLRGRPLTLKRYPNGVEGEFFYEKECPSWRPDWVRTAPVWSDRKEREINFCLIEDLPTLVWAANLADLELHTSLAPVEDLQRPTMIVFDLDPGEGTSILACARIALRLREMLGDLGLETSVKSSGSKGLHVHVPLNSKVTFDETRPFAQAVARLLEKQLPDRVISRQTRKLRGKKVLVDWSQNTAHKSTVCVFSLRARERPTVAVPLDWSEVAEAVERRRTTAFRFEAKEVLREVEERAALFEPVRKLKQRLPDLEDAGR